MYIQLRCARVPPPCFPPRAGTRRTCQKNSTEMSQILFRSAQKGSKKCENIGFVDPLGSPGPPMEVPRAPKMAKGQFRSENADEKTTHFGACFASLVSLSICVPTVSPKGLKKGGPRGSPLGQKRGVLRMHCFHKGCSDVLSKDV